MRLKLNIFLILILVSFIYTCKKDTPSVIPETYVDFTIRLSDPLFHDLNLIGNSVIVTSNYYGINSAGYNYHGIIVYRASQTEFYAFDRTCTVEEKLDQSVILDSPVDLYAECPECGSEFVLPSYGAPSIDGPAVHPLKQYYTN
ncbi:MAG: hypothetical protein J7L04_12070, partial [Bacteroidales bacterium]|nr:hypothetical protein [Bacteroidales bacterium]